MTSRVWKQIGAWAGVAGAVLTCMGSMLAALAGIVGVATTGMGMAGGQGTASSQGMGSGTGMAAHAGWLGVIGAYSWPILIVSLLLLYFAVRRAPRRAQWLVGSGAAILVLNEVAMRAMHAMYLWLYLPAIVLIVWGNVAALREPMRLNSALSSQEAPN